MLTGQISLNAIVAFFSSKQMFTALQSFNFSLTAAFTFLTSLSVSLGKG